MFLQKYYKILLIQFLEALTDKERQQLLNSCDYQKIIKNDIYSHGCKLNYTKDCSFGLFLLVSLAFY